MCVEGASSESGTFARAATFDEAFKPSKFQSQLKTTDITNNADSDKASDDELHANIVQEAEIMRELGRIDPCYCPTADEVPHIAELVRVAVSYAQSLSPTSKENNFIYHGKRYPLTFTTLGRVKVYDSAGKVLGASAYGVLD